MQLRDLPQTSAQSVGRAGSVPREPRRPGELLQRAQTGSYSQAETCRILLCTTRQQHPCAGTDRNKAQVGKAMSSHRGLHLHFQNWALRFCFISLCEPGLLWRARTGGICTLFAWNSFTPPFPNHVPNACYVPGSVPGAGEGHMEGKTKSLS